MHKIILFNPFTTKHGYRIPNSILQVGASIHGQFEYVFVDGNMERDPWKTIESYLKTGEFAYFGSTVMPGPQLRQAIPYSKKIREKFPDVAIIWGGYFASNQYQTCIDSDFVDYIINGPGDRTFPHLLEVLEKGDLAELPKVKNLIYKEEDRTVVTVKEALLNQDTLPDYPYQHLNQFYPLDHYLRKSHLGKRTIAYHSSFGCPFTCSFCAVVPIYNARWKGKSAESVYKDIRYLKENFGGDAIEFHDNNFFVSEKRTVEFSKLMLNEGINWWGEGRIDTLDKYKDESLQLMRDAGCKMIFFGAETGSDELLKQMDKGGKQSAEQIKAFAARLKKFDIIPEYSFVLGFPAESTEAVNRQIEQDIEFIREIKEINPQTEIIIYVYSPVPTEGSELFEQVKAAGFAFPEKLEDWLAPVWENFDLRKNPLTPWLTPELVDKIKNFETVLHARYPTASDFKLTNFQRKTMKTLSALRYKLGVYQYPYELKALQRFWLQYRQPEIEGFYLE